MANEKINRKTYLTQNKGDYPETTDFFGCKYVKVDDLRYGTNPHQPACYYKRALPDQPRGHQLLAEHREILRRPRVRVHEAH